MNGEWEGDQEGESNWIEFNIKVNFNVFVKRTEKSLNPKRECEGNGRAGKDSFYRVFVFRENTFKSLIQRVMNAK